MPAQIPKLNLIKPDGAVRWPVIGVVGPPNSGKSMLITQFAADPRVGTTYAVEWGSGDKGVLNEYSTAVPDANLYFLGHDSTVQSVYGQILAARELARTAVERGEPPHLLAIDSWSTCWELIKSWTYRRAAEGLLDKSKVPIDPNADLPIGFNLWNDARDRYRQVMNVILSWPGPVVLTCRGEWVSAVTPSGHPDRTHREYSIDAHKSLRYDVTALIRLSDEAAPQLVKCRSQYYPVKPGDKPIELARPINLGELIYDKMRVDPRRAVVPDTSEPLDALPEVVEGRASQVSEGAVIGRGRAPRPEPAQRSSAHAPKPVPLDWDAEIAKALAEPDPPQAYALISELWKAATLSDAAPAVCSRVRAAGEEIRVRLDAHKAATSDEALATDATSDELTADLEPAQPPAAEPEQAPAQTGPAADEQQPAPPRRRRNRVDWGERTATAYRDRNTQALTELAAAASKARASAAVREAIALAQLKVRVLQVAGERDRDWRELVSQDWTQLDAEAAVLGIDLDNALDELEDEDTEQQGESS
ncbi:hypothetical protein GCM10010174_25780 [Kutzneria viridogrisea]